MPDDYRTQAGRAAGTGRAPTAATGRQKWAHATGAGSFGDCPTPVVVGRVVYMGSDDRDV